MKTCTPFETSSRPFPSLRGRLESRLFRDMPAQLDLRDEVQFESLLATADALLGRVEASHSLEEIECLLAAESTDWPLGAQVAVKLARSKARVLAREGPLHVSVVFPVYAEHERILRPHEHPLGEGFLDRKLRELSWLFGSPRDGGARYEILVVDDGCPYGSGPMAEEILRARHRDAPVRVLYLFDAIEQELPVTAALRSTEDSQKGGAIQLGLWEATRRPRPGHVVVYTDADLSSNLGQCGLLLEALEDEHVAVAAGSRRARESVVVKSAQRSARGRLFIYLWKQLMPELSYLEDTQCGFKAMSVDTARRLVDRPSEPGFAFDLEFLLRCELAQRRSVAKVPIAWVDSEAASNLNALSPYLEMLRGTARLSREYLGERPVTQAFASVIDALDERAWERAIDRLGPRLEGVDPALDRAALFVSPDELMEAAA